MKSRDYYDILGVSKNATDDEIQRAYRKLARKYHPDVSKDKDAEKKFQELGEARDVLRDPEKRKLYDAHGRNWQHAGDGGAKPYRNGERAGNENFSGTFRFSGDQFGQSHSFEDIFEDIFSQKSFRQSGGRQGPPDAEGGRIDAEITVSLSDVYHGATRTITLQSYEMDHDGRMQPVIRTLQVKIPKGIADGAVMRLAGQGGRGSGRGRDGDLLLRINIAPDHCFRVQGHDLYTVIAVSPWEALLGAGIPVQTMDGTVTLSVPRGSQNGRRLRLRGKGLPKRNGAAGDIIVELEVVLPDSMTSREEQLYLELANISTFNPRSRSRQKAGGEPKG